MKEWRLWKRVKYESEVDLGFASEIASIPGGEKIFSCIQCGTCSGTCPVSQYMDYTPRRIVAMIRAGFKQEVLSSFTNWLCASCYSCSVECPRGVKITDVMYTLKRMAIQERVYPLRFPIPVLAREFYNSVMKCGRNNEIRLTLKLFLKTSPLQLLKQTFLGLRLLRQGRLKLKTESIENKKELHSLLQAQESGTYKVSKYEEHAVVGGTS